MSLNPSQNVERRKAEVQDALKKLQANDRISKIVLVVPADACPACRDIAGTYEKDETPEIPVDVCTHPLGCRSTYMPFIQELYP